MDVCRAIRANPATAGIAVLVVSGWTFESNIAAAHAAGADGRCNWRLPPPIVGLLSSAYLLRVLR